MTNLVTKVTVRQRPITKGQVSLYLDFYPAIRHPKTGKLTRREYLGIYIYANPKEQFQMEFNKSMLKKAEIIKCRRLESIINEEFGFLDHGQGREDFIAFFKEESKKDIHSNWGNTIHHFERYAKGKCQIKDLTVPFCQGFHTWLLTQDCSNHDGKLKANTANGHLHILKACLRVAFEEGLLKENIAMKLHAVKTKDKRREFLTHDELIRLANTPLPECEVLRRASLFSCLTGLRISDILALRWEYIVKDSNGYTLDFTTIKTGADAHLPISDETLELCGERREGLVFKELKPYMLQKYLKGWIKTAGIEKEITFHCFRHTYATLQLAAGTDLYTISKMLTHSDIGVTQVYADVVSDLKRDAANRISLKGNTDSQADK